MGGLFLKARVKWLAARAPVFPTYDAALAQCGDGYQAAAIVEAVERKSAVWATRPHGVPDTPGLAVLRTAIDLLERPHIIDFGGALGAHYWHVRKRPLRWSVVETPAMARRGKPSDELSFHDDIAAPGPADIVYCSSVLQELPDPLHWARRLAQVPAKLLILDRQYVHAETGFGVQYSRLSDNGPGPLVGMADRIVAYPFAFLREPDLVRAFEPLTLLARVTNSKGLRVSGRYCEAVTMVFGRP